MNDNRINRKKYIKCLLLLTAALGFSGCDVTGAIDPFLYGPKCDGANDIGHCKQDEYCDAGTCHLAGGLCKGATVNTNGFEYCLTGFECDADKKACLFVGGCLEDSDCREGMHCSDNRCVCSSPSGDLACADNEACCEGIGCVNLNTSSSHCSACGHVCGGGERCDNGQCVVSCQTGMEFCDDACDEAGNCDGFCVDTRRSREHCGACGNLCADGEVCNAGHCELSCQTGYTICDDKCVNLMLDRNHCGSCGEACPDGEVCLGNGTCGLSCQTGLDICDGWCVNLQSDPSNCGTCGNVCKGGKICRNGECSENCVDGLEMCYGSCVNLEYDNENCGGCGNVCTNGQVCTGGICTQHCSSGYTNCEGICVNLQTDNANCGTCGNACLDGQICNSGSCAAECDDNLVKCGYNCVDLNSDLYNCGACGTLCSNGLSCLSGKCMKSCPSDQTDCNAVCVNLNNNNNKNCGECGHVCDAGYACKEGQCILSCPDKYTNCNEACVDMTTDLNHCGQCGRACQQGETCTDGQCVIYCPEPRKLCGNGCYDLSTDIKNCGECGNACGSDQMCVNGECAEVCSGTTIKCLSKEATEDTPAAYTCVDPKVSDSYCGCTEESVGQSCASEVSSELGFCSNGACVKICNNGYYDCGMLNGLNCVDLQTDPMNCGACENQCTEGQSCVGGTCVCTDENYVAIELDGQRLCAINIASLEDLLKLQAAVNAGDITQAPGAPSDITQVVFAVSKSIDLGTQENWLGIGREGEDNRFRGTLVGLDGVEISGTLKCGNSFCGLFGRTEGARIDNLKLKLDVESGTYKYIGRLSGYSTKDHITRIEASGTMNSPGVSGVATYAGGITGVTRGSVLENIKSDGIYYFSPYYDYTNNGYFGGVAGDTANGCQLKNILSTGLIYSNNGRIGGITGRANKDTYDNVTFIGVITRSDTSVAYPTRIAGIAGCSDSVTVSNAQVIAKIEARDASGGILGITSGSTINNAVVVSYNRGEYGIGGIGGMVSSPLNNGVSISKVSGSSYGGIGGSSNLSVTNVYYDKALTANAKASGTPIEITYDSNNQAQAVVGDKTLTLAEALNNGMTCNEENVCKLSNAAVALPWYNVPVKVESLIGHDAIIPWMSKEMSAAEKHGMDVLNEYLKSK